MRRKTAAAYLDMSERVFLQAVARGDIPLPFRMGSREVWSKTAIDTEIERLASGAEDWRKDQPGLRGMYE
jgi:predicted DNA-binding transcriptional regulator AlpA